VVRFGTMDHSGSKDPDEGKHCPCALHQISCLSCEGGVGSTAATVKRTSLHPVILERVYAERDMTRTAKMNWMTRRGRPHEVLPIVGWTVYAISPEILFLDVNVCGKLSLLR
jgi:hypothetical protein